MKLIIDISEDEYKRIIKGNWIGNPLAEIIENGTPLPKGHGRLIDTNTLEYTCERDECGMSYGCNECLYHTITEYEIDAAPTIIEADTERSNDEADN